MTLTHATAQGSRSEQQDRFVTSVVDGGQLLAVMDGHGGARVAEILATHLTASFELALKAEPDNPLRALKATIQRLAQRTSIEPSGSTLSVVFIPADPVIAYGAFLGDSPILIYEAHQNISWSPFHNAQANLKERQAALQRGALYTQGYLEDPQYPGLGIQMTRTLGDSKLARILNREPELYTAALDNNSLILLATDGVLDSFDVELDKQFIRLVHLAQEGRDADAIVQDALQRQTGDNVTVIIWKA